MAAALLQLSEHAERLALIDDPRSRSLPRDQRRLERARGRSSPGSAGRSGTRPRSSPGWRAPASRSTGWPPGSPGSSPMATAMAVPGCISRRRCRGGGSWPARTAPGGAGQGAGLGRAGLPARLRPARRHPRPVLGAAPAVPVRPGRAVGAVVRALPPGRPQPRRASQRRPNSTPGSCPPSPSS